VLWSAAIGKHIASNVSTLLPKITLIMLLQQENGNELIVLTVLGIIAPVRLEQASNALTDC
jgi:hypothetical protein